MVIEGPIASSIVAALGKASVSTAFRLAKAVDPIGKKKKQDSQKVREKFRSLDFFANLQTKEIIEAVPEGISLRTVVAALDSFHGQSIASEVIALRILRPSGIIPPSLIRRLAATIARTGNLDPSDLQELAEICLEEIVRSIDLSLEQVRNDDYDYLASLQLIAATGMIASTVDGASIRSKKITIFEDSISDVDMQEWTEAYRRQLKTRHGHIVPPDFERKRKVPLDDLYVAPLITAESAEGVERVSIQDFMHSIDRTVLLGDPGGGKSTAGDWITNACAHDKTALLPFVVTLKDFSQPSSGTGSIVDFITRQLNDYYQCPAPEGAVEYLLATGGALVFFDGLDELIDATRRRGVTEIVELFSSKFPQAKILVTSRKVGYTEAQLDTTVFSTCELAGFGDSEVRNYVERWFKFVDGRNGKDLIQTCENFLNESSRVSDLTSTPLMLSLLCIIYRGQGYMPKNRPAVYEKCANLLFEKWDESRQIHVKLKAATQVDNAVKHLAYWMLTSSTASSGVRREELVRESASYLSRVFEDEGERLLAAREFVDFCKGRAWVLADAGTTADGEELYKFTHRTFMEYFAAYELTRICEGPERLANQLAPHLALGEWDVVGQLSVQIMDKHVRDGAERVLTTLLNEKRRRKPEKRDRILSFIWRCLNFTQGSIQLVKALVGESMLLSAGMLGGRDYMRDADRSIFESIEVMPEMRDMVALEIGREFATKIGSGRKPDASVAASMLATWPGSSRQTAASGDAARWWAAWALALIRDPDSQILGHETDAHIWNLLMSRSRVSMAEYIGAMKLANASVLDNLMEDPLVHSFSYSHVGWAELVVGSTGLFGDEELVVYRLESEKLVSDLERLSSEYPPDRATPWLSDDIRFPFFLAPLVRHQPLRNLSAKARWSLLVLSMATTEADVAAYGAEDRVDDRVLTFVYGARNGDTEMRAKALRVFALEGPHLEFFESWLRQDISLMGSGASESRSVDLPSISAEAQDATPQ